MPSSAQPPRSTRTGQRPITRDVDQVSKPMQIALMAIVLFAGAWFTVLRPSGDAGTESTPASTTAAKAPGQAGLERAVAGAKGAVAASDAASAATEAAADAAGTGRTAATTAASASAATATTASGATAAPTTPAAGASPAKAAATTDPSAAVLAQVARGKVAAILFTQAGGADDRLARQALAQLAKDDPQVVTRVVPVSQVGTWKGITAGMDVLQAPTVVLVGDEDKAVTVTGYTELATLAQKVGDLRRAAR